MPGSTTPKVPHLDPSVIARAVAGERSALDMLVRTLAPHVDRHLRRFPLLEEDRRDVLQVTLLRVVRCIHSFRGDSAFSTWLFRLTANEALMRLRSERRLRERFVTGLEVHELEALSASKRPSDHAPFVAASPGQDVRRALADLCDSDRGVLVAHHILGLGLQETAEHLALTESAVRSRLHRARKRLRTSLE
ncbi:sigma-70 family RNA polymerase sigma factor [Pendulispora rubella]|uniref:Sigma-70 family RNA polymerase sigma factor n=1 Tax=Pendulispora rubella TaxID=2741070 RepID=A0ABZ2KTT6_9BACT